MKIITTILITFFCFLFSFGQNDEKVLTDLKIVNELDGQWFIHQSNFPMWLKGDKTSPTFNYTLMKDKKGFFLIDKVSYIKNEKEKHIKGVDRPTNENGSEFIWRGNGIMRLIKSKWTVLYLDFEDNWGIIYFEKTVFTPKGYDVISKNQTLSSEIVSEIELKLNELGMNEELTVIPQEIE